MTCVSSLIFRIRKVMHVRILAIKVEPILVPFLFLMPKGVPCLGCSYRIKYSLNLTLRENQLLLSLDAQLRRLIFFTPKLLMVSLDWLQNVRRVYCNFFTKNTVNSQENSFFSQCVFRKMVVSLLSERSRINS